MRPNPFIDAQLNPLPMARCSVGPEMDQKLIGAIHHPGAPRWVSGKLKPGIALALHSRDPLSKCIAANTFRTKLEGCNQNGSGSLDLECLLHKRPKQLLLFVHKKLLLLSSATWPVPESIAGGFVLEPQRPQVVVETRDDLITHGKLSAGAVLQAFPKA